MPGKELATRADFPHLAPLPTRWADNDIYGHVNNVAYYSFFDTAVNNYLIDQCGLDIHQSKVIGLVIETGCQYHAPIEHPEILDLGVRVTRIGNSSVIYEIGVFLEGREECAANGRFVHVYVDRETRKPVSLPNEMRAGLEKILVSE